MSYGSKGKAPSSGPPPKRSSSPPIDDASAYKEKTVQYASYTSAAAAPSQAPFSPPNTAQWFSSPPSSAPGMAHAYAANVATPGPSTAKLYAEQPDTADQFQFSTTLRKASIHGEEAGRASYPPAPQPSSSSASLHYTHEPIAAILHSLATSLETGLSASSGAVESARTRAGGPNEFTVKASDPPWRKFLDQFKEPLILLLMGSAAVSAFMGEWDDAVSITIAVVIVISVAFVQEQRSEASLEALNKLVPHYAHLIRDNVQTTVLANELVPGDLVTFSTGDRIPADIRIAHSVALEIDESTLTGETRPRRKVAEVIPRSADGSDVAIADRDNIAFMGTLVKSGYGRGVVVGTGARTEFGMIFSMVDEVTEKRTPLQLSMDELAQKLSLISFAIIGVICIMGVLQSKPWLEMFTIGVSLAVAAIPEGLPIVVTVTLALGVLRMSKRKAIVKRLPCVETLGCVSVICSDKTGTLTCNQMAVVRAFTFEDGQIDLNKAIPHKPSEALQRSLLVGNLCNNSHRDSNGHFVGQATDVAMVDVLALFSLEDKRPYFQISHEVPFDSETKFMAVVGNLPSAAGGKADEVTFAKGALEVILNRCATYMGTQGRRVNLDDQASKRIADAAQELAGSGLRVLATAVGSTNNAHENKSLTFCALAAMQDPPRPGVQEAVAALSRGGVSVVMITGDSESTAVAIARQIGILRGSSTASSVMTGKQIDQLSEAQLEERIGNVAVFARTTPRHKMSIVKAFQEKGHVVAMTGDGVNDAPSLKQADIGISMGQGGTDVAKEAADVILVHDNFATILPAVEEGKGIFFNIQNFLSFQLSTAVAALTLITLCTAFGLKLPLNPMQILFINILMDGPPSQSLGVDPVDPGVMLRPPRSKTAPIITRKLIARICFSASIIVVGTLWVYVHELQDGFADQRDQTMTFTCFVLLDLTASFRRRHSLLQISRSCSSSLLSALRHMRDGGDTKEE
ncbi:ca-transporting atpase [Ceraceosorus bombacis]|uniref:Calcium-transporting ATPase n=1 Tax=Ceraceosorus bombacis TaxID=401625 RepID=A0A0P1B9W5_9BASI|nr:ca-transporting atpase [Ceraceosorus bombacis]